MDNIIKIIGSLIWPLTVLVILLIFKRPIISITELIGSVEIPGGAKILLDRTKVEKIIEEGAKKNVPAKQLADQIVKSAEDDLELRILRALFNEEDGRLIINYEKYYSRAMKSLLDKGYIDKKDKKYFLTQSGLKATQEYLINTLTHQGALAART
jgi:hypothetical protein